MDSRQLRLVPAGLAITLLAAVTVWTAWIGDDCLITWRTVSNVVDGHGPRWNVAERVQSYTHPLWLLGLVALRTMNISLYAGTLIASVGLTVVVALALVLPPAHRLSGAAVLVLLAGSRPFVDYSTSGLENPLTHALLAAFVLLLLRAPSPGSLAPFVLGCCLLLNRIDTAFLLAPPMLWLAWENRAWRRPATLIVAFAPLALWFVFATIYYGHPLPNTAFAKLNHSVPLARTLAQGLHYLWASVHLEPVTLPLLVVGLVAGAASTRAVPRVLATGLVTSLLYVVWTGGDFMIGRFITPALLVAALLLEDALARRPAPASGLVGAVALLGLAASPLSPIRTGPDTHDQGFDAWELADERAYYFSWSGLFRREGAFTNPVPERSAAPASALVTVAGGGLKLYKAEAKTHAVDVFALTDPLLARLLPDVTDRFRPGHLPRVLPGGYLESLACGCNVIVRPDVAALWDDVVLVTQGPLLAPGRFAAMRRLARRSHGVPKEYGGLESGRIDAPPWPAPLPIARVPDPALPSL